MGLFRQEQQRGDLCWEVCLQKETKKGRNRQQGICSEVCLQETKKGRNGWLSLHGAFYLGSGPILLLN
jgi:hypothetical protein